jgi:hypothetical protein
MAPASSKDMSMTPEDQWTYEERLNEAGWFVVITALIMLLPAAMAVIVSGPSSDNVPAVIIMAAGVTMYALRALARNVVVIDRRNGIVRIATVGVSWRWREVRALEEFGRVAVWERRTPIDAGYYASRYSIVLLGGNGPLPLLTTDDENEAAAVRDEVALFLRFR